MTKQEIKELLDGLPPGMPVLIDEAYPAYVDDPNYATSMPSVVEADLSSSRAPSPKIAAMAAMRIGYAVADGDPAEDAAVDHRRRERAGPLRRHRRPQEYCGNGRSQAQDDCALRERASRDSERPVAEVVPSQANFFMVGLRRDVQPVIQSFREEGVLVGRPFPPVTQHLRVSVSLPKKKWTVSWSPSRRS